MKRLFSAYSKFVSHNPILVLVLCFGLSVVMVFGVGMMETQDMDYKDMLPEGYDVIRAFTLIEEDFGGVSSGVIVIEIEDSFVGSNEMRRVVDPEVVRYSLLLEKYFGYLEDVESVGGFGGLVEESCGRIPNDLVEIREVAKSFGGMNYVSEREDMTLIKLGLSEGVDSEALTSEVLKLVNEIDRPEGIKLGLSGEVFEDVVVREQMGPDSSRTSMFSMIAIVVILFGLFRTIRGVIMPFMTIIFGVFWTMGFVGLIGSGLSSMTSGAISMIMGIGIDFGIQVMSRYNQELKSFGKYEAMQNTLDGILVPILTTAIACLIGFRAMGLGQLSMMAELGEIMSYGVLFCMVAAVSIVPALLVLISKSNS